MSTQTNMTGGPGDGAQTTQLSQQAAAASGAATQAANQTGSGQAATQTQQPVSTPVYLGTKKFNSMDELVQYTSQSEQEKQRALDELNKIRSTLNPAPSEPDIEEEFWQSPKKALEKVHMKAKEDAKREVLQEIESNKRAQETRDKFYGQYQDLKGNEDLVEFYASRMQKELETLAPDEQLSKVAHAVRAKVASIRGTQATTEELSSRPAVTVGATSGAPTQVNAPQAVSFVDQLRALRARGAKKK